MDAYTASDLDIRAVDPAALVDIRDVKVNTALPKRERILDFIRQIGIPTATGTENMWSGSASPIRMFHWRTDWKHISAQRADPATSSTVMRIAGTILE